MNMDSIMRANPSKTLGPLKNPLILALDLDSKDQALAMAQELRDLIGGIKVGPRLSLRYGAEFMRILADQAPLFVDMKFFDIPSTMESSVRTAFEAGASLVTVHGLAGPEALYRLSEVEAELNTLRPFCILCVTILTSWDQASLPLGTWRDQPIQDHVGALVKTIRSAGLKGVVCSPEEVESLYDEDPELFLVTPGVRLASDPGQDQKRISDPTHAIQRGASAIVVGRPILQSPNPRQAATDYSVAAYEGLLLKSKSHLGRRSPPCP